MIQPPIAGVERKHTRKDKRDVTLVTEEKKRCLGCFADMLLSHTFRRRADPRGEEAAAVGSAGDTPCAPECPVS